MLSQISNHIEKLGSGITDPVAYDTAWVARIPQLKDSSKPEYPKSLQWLRDHQLRDGSWGSLYPFSSQGNTLSTLATILTFKYWNYPKDQIYIKKGIEALWRLSSFLLNEKQLFIGFELLLPTMIIEAKNYNWNLPYEIYKKYELVTNYKKKLIDDDAMIIDSIKSWWFSLEAYKGLKSDTKDNYENSLLKIISLNNSVCASPSASAYFLLSHRNQRKDLPEINRYLSYLYQEYQGGISHVFPIDEFESTFSLSYLLQASISKNYPFIKSLSNKVIDIWKNRQENGIGYSTHFTIDPDDTACAIYSLTLIGYSINDLSSLTKFFNGKYFITFEGEREISISTNIHALMALCLYKNKNDINDIIEKLLQWFNLEIFKYTDIISFTDKWHCSPLYPLSRGLIAFYELDDNLFCYFLSWISKYHHEDGGWGYFNRSSLEETAYVALALAYCYRINPKDKLLKIDILRNGLNFINKNENLWNKDPFWIGKVLYSPTLVIKSVILSAKYSLETIFEDLKSKSKL
jgi:hypothetical protein